MPRSPVTDLHKILAGALVSAVLTAGGTVWAMQRQVDRVEVRQDEQYKALLQRIDDVWSRTRQGHEDIRMDLSGVRAEIMALLKERRR